MKSLVSCCLALVALLAAACGAQYKSVKDTAAEACKKGDRDQCIKAARPYIYDTIVKRDVSAEQFVREYMSRACSLKHAGACTFLARIYTFGIPGKGDRTAEERHLAQNAETRLAMLVTPLCKSGNKDACDHMASYYELTDRPSVAEYYRAGARGERPTPRAKKPEPKPTGELKAAKRIRGTIRIAPSKNIRMRLHKAGINRVVALMRLCLDDTGRPKSVRVVLPTGIHEYERLLIRRMRMWQYTPFTVNGQPRPVCTIVTYIYKQGTRYN